MIRKNFDAILMFVLLAMTFAGFALWNSYAPMAQDDFYFTTMVPDGDMEAYSACEGSPIESFSDAVVNVGQVFLYDSGRWPNLLHVLFVPFPPLVERLFNALILTLVLWLMMRFGGGRWRAAPVVSVLSVLMLWCAFPWYNNFESLAYQANYIWMSAVVLAFMVLAGGYAAMSGPKYGLLLLLAFVIGQGHEGFAICAGSWFAAVALAGGRRAPGRVWAVLALMALGLCVNLYSGTAARLGTTFGGAYSIGGLKYSLSRLASQAWPFWLAAAVCCLSAVRARSLRIPSWTVVYPLLAGSLVNIGIVVVLQKFQRALWPLDLMSGLALIVMASSAVKERFAGIAAVAAVLFAAVYGWWLVELVKWERVFGQEHAALMAEMAKKRGERTEVFAGSHTPSSKAPWYLMEISHNQHDDVYNRSWTRSYFNRGAGRTFIVASDPSMLGPFEEWPLIPGTAGVRGVWPMIAMADTTADRHLMFTVGAPAGNETPIDRLLIRIKEGPAPADVKISLGTVFHPIVAAGEGEAYAIETEPLPRTLKLRDVIRIDTIAAQP